jgi:hypothetical protein
MAANPAQWYNTLRQKLQPSFDIQRAGSSQYQLRNSSTFGPQMATLNWRRLRGKQAGETIQNQLGNMSR